MFRINDIYVPIVLYPDIVEVITPYITKKDWFELSATRNFVHGI